VVGEGVAPGLGPGVCSNNARKLIIDSPYLEM